MSDPTPLVPGFRLQRDPLTDEWIATSPSGFVIRGWTQRDLEANRWALWRQAIDDFHRALVEVYPPTNQTPASSPSPRGARGTGCTSRPAGTGRAPEGVPATSPVSPGPAAEKERGQVMR